MTEKLVIMADDYGLTRSVTEGILRGLDDGVVTDVSVMANGEYFAPAVTALLQRGRECVGIHLTAVDAEQPVAEAGKVPRLVCGRTGTFLSRNELMLKSIFDPGVRRQLRVEFAAQFEKILRAGLKIAHVSSHQHIHLFPLIAPIVIDLAKQFNVPYIRLPGTRSWAPAGVAVNVFAAGLARQLKAAGLKSCDFVGMEFSGCATCGRLKNALAGRQAPFVELMVHPGFADEQASKKYPHWKVEW